jgi:membrane protease subunit (stomatin/prohibitin family)
MKWGTANPIMLRDADFGIVRLRAFGAYSLRVADPAMFIKEVAGTNAHFQTEDIDEQLKRGIVTEFSDAIGEMKIPALDLAAQYKELGEAIRAKSTKIFSTLRFAGHEILRRKYFSAGRSRKGARQTQFDGRARRRQSLYAVSSG